MFQLDVSMEIHRTYGMPRVFLEALRLLDEVDLALIFRRRVVVMKSVPKFMHGVFRVAALAA